MDAKFTASEKQGTWSLAICWVQMGIQVKRRHSNGNIICYKA